MSGFIIIIDMEEVGLLSLLLVGGFVGAAAGYLGSFMVLKRMSLIGDALSHVALPGMAIAIALSVHPLLGAFIALTIAVIGVWYFEETSQIYPEALVGVFFTASLAFGILITPEPDLLEALFGNIEKISIVEGIIAIVSSFIIILITWLIAKKLVLGVISYELVESLGISSKKINLLYLLLVGGIVALGIKFVGTLLMGALVIIPAVSAKNISRSMFQYGLFSIIFGIASTSIGAFVAHIYHAPTGPIVVLVSIAIFMATYIASKLTQLR